jgi:hypothetical protein
MIERALSLLSIYCKKAESCTTILPGISCQLGYSNRLLAINYKVGRTIRTAVKRFSRSCTRSTNVPFVSVSCSRDLAVRSFSTVRGVAGCRPGDELSSVVIWKSKTKEKPFSSAL